jgi:D-aminopeptidase
MDKENRKRIRDYGITVGTLHPGKMNSLSDVPGVKVGHVTLSDGPIQTGVTAVLPHGGNLFQSKVMGAADVINGFGKSVGLMQIEELGTIETPIVLTNTLNVGIAADALLEVMLNENPEIGITTGTVNPVVCECNDGYLNKIRERYVTREHIVEAIQNAGSDIQEGAVGAGTGMSCYHLKGGIGTASRLMMIDGTAYTLGVLVLTNFGKRKDLMVNGRNIGPMVTALEKSDSDEPDKGSVIVIAGTDLPVSERQLKRIARRAVTGLVRTGSYLANGSGDVVVAFSTANQTEHEAGPGFQTWQVLNENLIDLPFRAIAEATEEAVLNSLTAADTAVGRDGNRRTALGDYLEQILKADQS